MHALLLAAQLAAGAQVTALATRADPTPGDSTRTELRLIAPILFGSAGAGALRIHLMLNAEGLTVPGGQLATGNFGEGYVDRRHPHTWLHELIVTLVDPLRLPGSVRWSLSAGKGFAPFGSDDPMIRAPVVYPLNHHWSQILERAVAIVALRRGPATLEAGVFNGDEPEGWNRWPDGERFGDSYSARLTLRPLTSVEVQGSFANVRSPEHRPGAGLRHRKYHVAASVSRPVAIGVLDVLGEWSKTVEGGFFHYYSGLLEAQFSHRPHRAYARLERTDRPEEMRLNDDSFRSVRPHHENSNIGITRWSVATLGFGLGLDPPRLPARAEVIGEAALLHVTSITGGVFDPAAWYGRNDLWMLSVGVRVAAGSRIHRMGRYGVAHHDGAHPSHHRDE